MLRNNLLNLLGAGLMFFSDQAQSYEMLIAGRLVIGICAGNKFKLLEIIVVIITCIVMLNLV